MSVHERSVVELSEIPDHPGPHGVAGAGERARKERKARNPFVSFATFAIHPPYALQWVFPSTSLGMNKELYQLSQQYQPFWGKPAKNLLIQLILKIDKPASV